jgi:hypothetical protein
MYVLTCFHCKQEIHHNSMFDPQVCPYCHQTPLGSSRSEGDSGGIISTIGSLITLFVVFCVVMTAHDVWVSWFG